MITYKTTEFEKKAIFKKWNNRKIEQCIKMLKTGMASLKHLNLVLFKYVSHLLKEKSLEFFNSIWQTKQTPKGRETGLLINTYKK
jgi:hypothetical protein